MFDFTRNRRRTQELPLTALIDVMFILLIFLLLTTTFTLVESMELSVPSSGVPSSSGEEQVMRIFCNPNGGSTVDGKNLSLSELDTLLGNTVGQAPDTKVLVLSTEGVSVQQLVAVMDLVYLNGGRKVQIDRYESLPVSVPAPTQGGSDGISPL